MSVCTNMPHAGLTVRLVQMAHVLLDESAVGMPGNTEASTAALLLGPLELIVRLYSALMSHGAGAGVPPAVIQ